jgi:hypothetical protein
MRRKALEENRAESELMTIIQLPITGTVQEKQYARHYQ